MKRLSKKLIEVEPENYEEVSHRFNLFTTEKMNSIVKNELLFFPFFF